MGQICGFQLRFGRLEVEVGTFIQRQDVIDVGLVHPPLLPGEQPVAAQFIEVALEGIHRDVEVGSEAGLTGEAGAILPGVIKEQRIEGLRVAAEAHRTQHRARHLGEAETQVGVEYLDNILRSANRAATTGHGPMLPILGCRSRFGLAPTWCISSTSVAHGQTMNHTPILHHCPAYAIIETSIADHIVRRYFEGVGSQNGLPGRKWPYTFYCRWLPREPIFHAICERCSRNATRSASNAASSASPSALPPFSKAAVCSTFTSTRHSRR